MIRIMTIVIIIIIIIIIILYFYSAVSSNVQLRFTINVLNITNI